MFEADETAQHTHKTSDQISATMIVALFFSLSIRYHIQYFMGELNNDFVCGKHCRWSEYEALFLLYKQFTFESRTRHYFFASNLSPFFALYFSYRNLYHVFFVRYYCFTAHRSSVFLLFFFLRFGSVSLCLCLFKMGAFNPFASHRFLNLKRIHNEIKWK